MRLLCYERGLYALIIERFRVFHKHSKLIHKVYYDLIGALKGKFGKTFF